VNCHYCSTRMTNSGVYGKNLALDSWGKPMSGFQKAGDIFYCDNVDCEAYCRHFYTDLRGNLHEGYPC
jgi:hypothetical protein